MKRKNIRCLKANAPHSPCTRSLKVPDEFWLNGIHVLWVLFGQSGVLLLVFSEKRLKNYVIDTL
jgi:hypothetical protein